MTNPDELFSLWRERNQVISDTETETEEEPGYITPEETSPIMEATEGTPLTQNMVEETCYDFKRFRQSSTVIGSKVQCQMSLEECKFWTCIVLLGLIVKFK